MAPGPRNSITDIDGLLVGNASDEKIKSGVTVLVGNRPFTAAVHVMGGAPGTRETDLLAPDRLVQEVDAIVLSGGSAFGLDAASGVADGLSELGRGFAVGSALVPIVPGAILFDLLNGGRKEWKSNPYNALGREALQSVSMDVKLGTVGAGAGATTSNLKGGLGTASAITDRGFVVGAIVAVNAVGSAIQHGRPNFWAAPYEFNGEFGGLGLAGDNDPCWEPAWPKPESRMGTNTTIAIVGTDAKLTQAQATRMAVAAHDGIGRALVPAHTVFDGDLVFAAATGSKPVDTAEVEMLSLGHAAASCLARAIARGVYSATREPGDIVPTWQQEFG